MKQTTRRQKFIKKNKIISTVEEIFRSSVFGYGISRYLAGRFFYKYLGESDFEFFGLVNKKKEHLFVDIGANDGISALTFRLYNQDYKIISFEPDTKHNKALERVKKKIKNFEFNNIGLGNKNEKKTLYIPECKNVYIGQLASLIRDEAKNNVAKIISKKNILDDVKIVEKEINISTLDELNLIPEIIKIDVEGYESEVLEGSLNTIKKYKPFLMIEINEVSVKKVQEFLSSCNYKIFEYDKGLKKIKELTLENIELGSFVMNIICVNVDRINEVENYISRA